MFPETFSCPDCDNGIMRKMKGGALPETFKCSLCYSEIIISRKTMKYLIKTE